MRINLLPWREDLRRKQTKRLIGYGSVVILLLITILIYSEYYAKKHILEQSLLNQKLQEDIQQLKRDYRKKLREQKILSIAGNKGLQIKQRKINANLLKSEVIRINYAKVLEIVNLLRDKSNAFLSEKGVVMADNRTNTLWIEDTDVRIQKIKKYLRMIDVPKRQVLIEARIVNLSRDAAEDLGVRFGILNSTSSIATDAKGSKEAPSDANFSNRLNLDLGAQPLDATPASIGISLLNFGKHVLLDMELSALESEGQAEILASPSLLTMNKEAAIIESGEDIPYQEYVSSGATAVAFKKAVLSLKVIPEITFDRKLMLSLSINQGADSGKRVQGVPILLTKAIETNVIVSDEQTIVLGGIYKQAKNDSVIMIPVLGTLPVIGHLFRRTQARMRNEVLFIFITPKILTVK